MDSDDLFLLRLDRAAPRPARSDLTGSGSPAFVGRVVTTGPTAANHFVLVHPVVVTGPETEGGAATLTVDTGTSILVLFLGPGSTSAGDDLVVRWGDYRWVAEKKGAAGDTVALPGCQCTTTPTTLYMVPNDPTLNGGMFQNAVLQWGPTPAEYAALALGTNTFLSVASYTDQLGESFRYYFTCVINKYTLTRIYAHSIFGSPFRDTVRYTWTIGVTGNTCTPWLLTVGQVYQGGDNRTQILITPTPP